MVLQHSTVGAMNFTLKFNYLVKNRVVIARKKIFSQAADTLSGNEQFYIERKFRKYAN